MTKRFIINNFWLLQQPRKSSLKNFLSVSDKIYSSMQFCVPISYYRTWEKEIQTVWSVWFLRANNRINRSSKIYACLALNATTPHRLPKRKIRSIGVCMENKGLRQDNVISKVKICHFVAFFVFLGIFMRWPKEWQPEFFSLILPVYCTWVTCAKNLCSCLMLIWKLKNRRCYFNSLNRRFDNAAFFRVQD